jgi:hypothetical protein
MDRIKIQSTSRHSAEVSDVLIRDLEQVRLVFRPEIVNNPSDPAACLRGRFSYQRKGKKDSWEDFDVKPLSSLRKGDQFQLEIKSAELLHLLRELAALYRVHHKHGVPQGRVEFFKIEQNLARLLDLSELELNEFLSANRADAVKTLRRVLRWLADRAAATEQLASDETELSELNALVGLANLRAVLKIWTDNCENGSEEFWQDVLTKHTLVLSQLFAYPIVVIKDKAYVGGKRTDNLHGNLVDFLGKISTSEAAVLIEIKNPRTPLLGPMYRQVYPPSHELGGALSQVLSYRESLMHEVHNLTHGVSSPVSGSDPRCVIIMGCAARELNDDAHKRSFERFRDRLAGVTVVTFDEVFNRIRGLVELFARGEEVHP